ncbi:MAG: DUF503 domain-containing protein [Clostridiales bacterium]|nr:DUF503 domain-containing protein [Clostridiales bacterium]
MVIGSCVLKIRVPWVNSLKEKRMELKRIVERTKNKFNLSVAEVGENDNHKVIEIGMCCAANDSGFADSVIENAVNFIERTTDGEIFEIVKEIL